MLFLSKKMSFELFFLTYLKKMVTFWTHADKSCSTLSRALVAHWLGGSKSILQIC